MHKTLALLILVLISAGLYVVTLRGEYGNSTPNDIRFLQDSPARPFELSPERGRYAHTVTLADTGQYALNQTWAEVVYPDVGFLKGKFYSYFAPGISYLTAPVYAIFSEINLGQVASFGVISLLSIVSLIVIFLICYEVFKLPASYALLGSLIFAFSTTAWSYAITLYQHHITVLCGLLGIFAVWKFTQGKIPWAWASLAGLMYGLAITVDYPNALILLPIPAYLAYETFKFFYTDKKISLKINTQAIAGLITAILLIASLGLHNYTYFQNPLKLSGSLVGYKTIVENNLQDQPIETIEKAVEARAEEKANVVNFFSEKNIVQSFSVLFFSSDRGLILFSPVLLLGFLGMFWVLYKKLNPISLALSTIVALNVFLYSSWGDPWGGWAYGPRYLIPSMAVLSIFLVVFLHQIKWKWLKLLAYLLIGYSTAIALLGALTGNAVPPKVEGLYLNAQYNFFQNLDWLVDGRSGSYFFNTFLASHISLSGFALLLYFILLIVFGLLLFVPKRGDEHAN